MAASKSRSERRKAPAASARKVRVPTAATIIKGIETPEGFTRSKSTYPKDGRSGYGGFKVLTLESPDTKIELYFDGGRDSYHLASGHVEFDTPMGRRSFDRYGVEDSFYVDNPLKRGEVLWAGVRVHHGIENIFGTVVYVPDVDRRLTCITWDGSNVPVSYDARQLKVQRIVEAGPTVQANEAIRKVIEERIPAVRERLAKSEQVPDLPFTVTPEHREQIVATLQNGRSHRFVPSGFGTGYTLTANRSRWARPGSKALAEFFGLRSIYVETFDAD